MFGVSSHNSSALDPESMHLLVRVGMETSITNFTQKMSRCDRNTACDGEDMPVIVFNNHDFECLCKRMCNMGYGNINMLNSIIQL